MTYVGSVSPSSAQRPRALVTGASMGIGEGFARALAARGDDLVLVARSEAALQALASELATAHSVRVDVIVADFAQPTAVDTLTSELSSREIEVGTLINNAGFGTHGFFAELEPQHERDEITVNILSLVALTRALLPAMIARGSGSIINLASTAAFQPVPYMATYAATKAFVLSYSVALAQEVRSHGIGVVALCPGQTTTAFFDHIEGARVGFARTVEQVVATGMRALSRGTDIAVDGPVNVAMTASVGFVPKSIAARMAAKMMRPSALR